MGLLEQIETALENDRAVVIINNLQLPVKLTYYVTHYGLKRHDLNKHQVRSYIKYLIDKDYEEWSRANRKVIEMNGSNRIVEREVK